MAEYQVGLLGSVAPPNTCSSVPSRPAASRLQSPTDGVLLLIRILSKTQNATDLPNVRSIQAGISVQPYKFQFDPTP